MSDTQPAPADQADWVVKACHEVGHAVIGDHVGRVFRRIEWIIDENGSRAQFVTGDTVIASDDLEVTRAALHGRLLISVAGVVAVELARGSPPTIDVLRNDQTCADDFEQAIETATLMLGPGASDDQKLELIAEVMHECQMELTQHDRAAYQQTLVSRLLEMRRSRPRGLVVLDSREFDEALRRVEGVWFSRE
jgi:hypothetical protein